MLSSKDKEFFAEALYETAPSTRIYLVEGAAFY